MVQLLLYLIIRASHEDTKWQGKIIKRGQLVTGLKAIKRDTGLSIRKIRTGLSRLTLTGEIRRKVTNKYSIITVCNYDKYQIKERGQRQASDKPATIKRQASDNIQEVKELKNIKKTTKSIVFPVWLDQKLWADFKEMRKIIKAPMTTRAEELAFKRIEKLNSNGTDPNKIIEQSLINGWKGFFPIKDDFKGGTDGLDEFLRQHQETERAHGKKHQH